MSVLFGKGQWCRREFESRRGHTGVQTIVLKLLARMTLDRVSQRVGQQHKFTARNGDRPEAMDVTKGHQIWKSRDMRKNPTSSERT